MSSTTGHRGFLDHVEETFIAIIMGLMTVITFANVIARYVFNANILWALEVTVYLFAWLVLVGAAYCVKINAHLGVDVLVERLGPGAKRGVTLFAAACCIAFAVLLRYGAWQYWAPFAGERAWYETSDIPMPGWLRFVEPLMNEGEAYEKLPRFIPYFALPFGMLLLTLRFVQAAARVWTGQQVLLVASHEAEDDIEAAAAAANAPLSAEGRDPRAGGPF